VVNSDLTTRRLGAALRRLRFDPSHPLCSPEKLATLADTARVAQSLALDVRDRFAWDIPPELTDVFTKIDPLFYNP